LAALPAPKSNAITSFLGERTVKRTIRCLLKIVGLAFPLIAAPTHSQEPEPHLLITANRRVVAVDAEYHLGLVADSKDAAAENLLRLNAALAACHPSGDFDAELVARGLPQSGRVSGPILVPITFSAKAFFFKGQNGARSQIIFPEKTGTVLLGVGGGGSPLGEGNFNGAAGDLGGQVTRLYRLDPETGDTTHPFENGSFVVLSGNGAHISGIQFNGRYLPTNTTHGLGWSVVSASSVTPIRITLQTGQQHGFSSTVGESVIIDGVTGNDAANGQFYAKGIGNLTFDLYEDEALTTPVAGLGNGTGGTAKRPQTPCGITVVSNNTISSGKHLIENCIFTGFDTMVRGLDGWFDENGENFDDTFGSDGHADNVTFRNIKTHGVNRLFHSLENQSFNWQFQNLKCLTDPTVCFDMELGGFLMVDHLSAGKFNTTTLLRLHEYRKNARYISITNWYADGGGEESGILRLVDYAGGAQEGYQSDWHIRITGHIAGTTPDPDEWFKIVSDDEMQTLDTSDIWWDISRFVEGTPPANHTYQTVGPWTRLKPD
jgi:hypothetical protein